MDPARSYETDVAASQRAAHPGEFRCDVRTVRPVSRMLFVALAGHGHITPTLPLVDELVRRGHRVEYACGSEFRAAVEAVGSDWVGLPSLVPFDPPPEVGPEAVALWFRHFFAGLAATYPVLARHCREQRPDVIVYDATNWQARLVARELGIFAVRTVPNLAENETYSGVDQALHAGLVDDPEMAAFADDVAAFAARHGVDLDVASTLDVAEVLNLVFVPREFQPRGETFDDRFRFLGPVLGRRLAERWAPPDPSRPLVYISLGSIFTARPDFYRRCLDAFDDGRWQVAMTTGEADTAALGPVPDNVEIRPWFPQLDVLEHASAFVTHAGMGSTMEAIYHSVPMMTVPQMPEQVVNADRIVELGLGSRLDAAAATPDDLRRAVEVLSSSAAIRRNLDDMRDRAREAGGAIAGADIVEQFLAEPS